jgi:hypothetical protein
VKNDSTLRGFGLSNHNGLAGAIDRFNEMAEGKNCPEVDYLKNQGIWP